MFIFHIGLKRPKVVYRSLYSATVASQSLPNGFPYCYRPILSIDINRTWAHHAIFRLHTCDMATARRGPPAFVTIVSTAHAHSRRTTSSRPQEFAESRVQREQTRKTVRLRPSGSRNSVHTVRATTKERHCNTARRCTPEGALTRASTHELSTPKWGGESCSCSPSAHTVEVEPKSPRLREENAILATLVPTTSATHGTRPLRSTAVAIAPLPLPACLQTLTIPER